MTRDPMGELRSLLHEPQRDSFTKLLNLLHSWPNDDELFEVALPYCHDLIDQWPKAFSRHPGEFLQVIYGHSKKPKYAHRELAILSLASSIYKVFGYYAPKKFKKIPQIELPPLQPQYHTQSLALHLTPETKVVLDYLTQHEMPNLNQLMITSTWEPDLTLLDPLMRVNWLGTNLRHVHVARGGAFLTRLLQIIDLSHVEHLSISGAEGAISGDDLQALLDKTNADHLRELDCTDAWLRENAGHIIASHPSLRQLESLDVRYNMGIDIEGGLDAMLHSTTLPQAAKDCINDQYEDIFE